MGEMDEGWREQGGPLAWRWWLPPLLAVVPIGLGLALLLSLPGQQSIYYPIVRSAPKLALALAATGAVAVVSGGFFARHRLWFTLVVGLLVGGLGCAASTALLAGLDGPQEVDGVYWVIASDGVLGMANDDPEAAPLASAWLYRCGDAGWCTRCKAFTAMPGSSWGAVTAFPESGEAVECEP
ncbi:MAG: hypothetical protein KC912_18945 [Proteobacteria bacterium]|nr:hypothetical protein [Pseudomonadota bacterium]